MKIRLFSYQKCVKKIQIFFLPSRYDWHGMQAGDAHFLCYKNSISYLKIPSKHGLTVRRKRWNLFWVFSLTDRVFCWRHLRQLSRLSDQRKRCYYPVSLHFQKMPSKTRQNLGTIYSAPHATFQSENSYEIGKSIQKVFTTGHSVEKLPPKSHFLNMVW